VLRCFLKVRYEDLVADPAAVVASLRSSFGINGPIFANIEDSTKSSAKDYEDYRDYYLHEK